MGHDLAACISNISRDTIVGLVSSLMSMIRAMGNGGKPAAHAAVACAVLEAPPEPASSTKMTKGLPPIVTGIVCCATEPSFHKSLLISRGCGLGLRAWM